MKKGAIKNIQDSFESNPNENTLHHNEFGHCFKAGGAGLTAISREEAEKLKEEEDATSTGSGSEEETGGKKKKK